MERDLELDEFNKGPTNGTLSDKKRLAFIYEEILNIRDFLVQKECPNCGFHPDMQQPGNELKT